MPIVILCALGLLVLLLFSRRLLPVVFHVHVRHFLLITCVVSVVVIIGLSAFLLWKYWWPIYMATPVVEYRDETLEEDKNPYTPGTGGPPQPVIIQIP